MGAQVYFYTDDMGDKICEELTKGRSLLQICLDPGMPTRDAVNHWVLTNKDFHHKYTRAREAQSDYLVDEIIKIADIEFTAEERKSPGLINALMQQRKLQTDSRKWYASKVMPKRYGDKTDEQKKTEDEENPLLELYGNDSKELWADTPLLAEADSHERSTDIQSAGSSPPEEET